MNSWRMQGGKRVNVPRLVQKVDGIARWNRRAHAWVRGRQDGRIALNGSPQVDDFLGRCSFLQKGKAYSENLYTKCLHDLTAYGVYLTQWKANLAEQRSRRVSALAELLAQAEGVRCERPSFTERSYHRLAIIFFLAEFAFSYMNLVYSSLPGGIPVEAVLSFVCALFLVYLADAIGRRYRRLPLPLLSSSGERVRVWMEILVLGFFLVGILAGLTYLRARGMRGEGEGNDLAIEVALMIMGLGFSVAAGWIAGQTEYSGPKYGAAKLEAEIAAITTVDRVVNTEQERVQNAGTSLRAVVNRHLERIAHIYLDQYRRNFRHSGQAA